MKPTKASPRLRRLINRLEEYGLNFGSETLDHLGVELSLRAYLGIELDLTPAELEILEIEVRKLAGQEDIRQAINQERGLPTWEGNDERLGFDPSTVHIKGTFWPKQGQTTNKTFPLSSGRRRC